VSAIIIVCICSWNTFDTTSCEWDYIVFIYC